MKNKVLFSVLGFFLLIPTFAQAQVIQGYQLEPKSGIRWHWKAFPETLSVDITPTGTEWVIGQEQAIFGNAIRTFIPKGKTPVTAQEGITIDFIDYNLIPQTIPLDKYVDLTEENGRLLCGSQEDAYNVKVLKQTANELIVQLTMQGCHDQNKSLQGTEIRRIIKGQVGLHSIFYTVKAGNLSEKKILEMRKVLESAVIIDGKNKS